MVVSAVEPEINDGVKTTISNAGSASDAISISRRAPIEPKAVPTSIAANAMNTRASASSPTNAITSAAGENGRSVASTGTIDAASSHAAEHDVGRDAEQRRGVIGQHRVLQKQLSQHPVRLQPPGTAAVLQPGPALVDPTQHQRCSQHHQQGLEQLGDQGLDHRIRNSSVSNVTKLYTR